LEWSDVDIFHGHVRVNELKIGTCALPDKNGDLVFVSCPDYYDSKRRLRLKRGERFEQLELLEPFIDLFLTALRSNALP
jgi:hypothetical protein